MNYTVEDLKKDFCKEFNNNGSCIDYVNWLETLACAYKEQQINISNYLNDESCDCGCNENGEFIPTIEEVKEYEVKTVTKLDYNE